MSASRERSRRLVLLGHPLGHTLSPALHAAALDAAGIVLTYEALDVAPSDLDATLALLVAQGAAGNVTRPHKARVAAHCSRRTRIAERAGAVNTFWVEDGALVGDNTDVGGFDVSVRALVANVPDAVALIGAGGAAGAVLAALERHPDARARVWSRSLERAATLAARFPRASVAPTLAAALRGATLVVNATPLGLAHGDPLPAPVDRLDDEAAVVDLVYRRGETRWVREARARGHAASDGLPMLVEQAALAFEQWFGVTASRDAMWDAVGGRPPWMGA